MRAFIAVKIPDAVKEKLSELQETLKEVEGIKWVAPKNMHLTLKFLGEIKEEQIEEIGRIVKFLVQDIRPFNISFGTLGGFPNLSRPRVLWIGVREGKQKLAGLMNKLNKELSRLGIEQESRESLPHLTIGRVKKERKGKVAILNLFQNLKVKDFESSPFVADRVYLIKSQLTPEGPIYTDIKEFKI